MSENRQRGDWRTWLKPFGLFAAILAISGLHYSTDPSLIVQHEVYRYLYYLPIIVGAYWYGPWGGLATALGASGAYLPHIHEAWAPNVPYTVSQYAQLVVFHLLGLSVGVLASSQRRLTEKYRDAAQSLERANLELRESQEQLRRADRLSALGEVAAGLAHEIRNPLAGVKGALEILTSRVQVGTREAEFADVADRELKRLDELVGDFLNYARPHAPECRDTELGDVVEHVAALARPQAERAGVRLDIDRRAMVPPVYIDARQIGQVFFNVVLNAIQASPRGKTVRICEGLDADTAVVDVIDEGSGIAPGHAGRIFDPFFTTKARGTGLGLAVSHRIVTAHAGTIEVLPRQPHGTHVRIRLPLSTPSREAASRPGAQTTA